jgi:hypothetical protein
MSFEGGMADSAASGLYRAHAGRSGSLDEAAIASYKADGYVFPLVAMSTEDANGYRSRLEQYETAYPDVAAKVLRQKSHLVLTFVDELIRLDPVLDAVESLIGPDILCWSTSFFIKNPGDQRFISWHQDAQYWGLEADDIVTAWIALTPSHTGNGCMKVLPRSHLALLPHENRPSRDNMLTRGQEVAATVDEQLAVPVELAAGEFSLHHERIVHGSRPNDGDERRIGLAVRYIRPTARQVVDAADTASLVRGVDGFGHFGLERRPSRDMEPEAVEFLETLLATRAGGVFRRPS